MELGGLVNTIWQGPRLAQSYGPNDNLAGTTTTAHP
jgi:hypothetical protein